jgi:GWxTD domain-containing protein
MKKSLFFLCGLTCIAANLQAVSLFLDYARFQDPKAEPYIEVYITVDGTSVQYRPAQGQEGYQAKVELYVQLLRLQEDGDTSIQFIDRYNLLSPLASDTSMEARKAFPDLKRIMTPPGLYALRVIAKDVYGGSETDHLTVVEVPEVKQDSFRFSDVEFVASIRPSAAPNVFTKHGRDIIPFGLEGTFINQDSLQFYVELYGTDKVFQEAYYVQASLYQGEQQLFQHTLTKKKAPSNMDVFTGGFRIKDMPPSMGDAYSLRLKAFNSQQKELPELIERVYIYSEDLLNHMPVASSSTIFDNLSNDEVSYYISTLVYISESEDEIRLARSLPDPEARRDYLAGFWEKRAQADTESRSPELLWETHRFAIQYTNEQFESAFQPGWKTDRGRVFITYGPPSDIERYPNERGTVPHEIWKYDKLGTQAQVVFIFIDRNHPSDQYELSHSTKYGELQNPTWRSDLLQGTSQSIDLRWRDLNSSGDPRVDYEADHQRRIRIRN